MSFAGCFLHMSACPQSGSSLNLTVRFRRSSIRSVAADRLWRKISLRKASLMTRLRFRAGETVRGLVDCLLRTTRSCDPLPASLS